jgi:thioredoxin-related protein
MSSSNDEELTLFEKDVSGSVVGVDFTAFTPVDSCNSKSLKLEDFKDAVLYDQNGSLVNLSIGQKPVVLIFLSYNCKTCRVLFKQIITALQELKEVEIKFIVKDYKTLKDYPTDNLLVSEDLFKNLRITATPYAVIIQEKKIKTSPVASYTQLRKLLLDSAS